MEGNKAIASWMKEAEISGQLRVSGYTGIAEEHGTTRRERYVVCEIGSGLMAERVVDFSFCQARGSRGCGVKTRNGYIRRRGGRARPGRWWGRLLFGFEVWPT